MTDADIEAIGLEKAWRVYRCSFIFSTPKQLVAFARAVIDADRAQRVPLTEAEILKMWGLRSDGPDNHEIISFARAVERAHGIGAKP